MVNGNMVPLVDAGAAYASKEQQPGENDTKENTVSSSERRRRGDEKRNESEILEVGQ